MRVFLQVVLLANGRKQSVSTLKPGQQVLATDTRTGRNHAESIAFPAGIVHVSDVGRVSVFSVGTGRSVDDGHEMLLAELRHRQQDPDGRAKLRERVAVEYALAHVGHWQGCRARYRGTRKNLFDLRRVAVVHNLHVIARRPATDSYQPAA